MARPIRRRRTRPVALLLGLIMLTAACGSRLTEQEIVARNTGSVSGPAATGPDSVDEGATGVVPGEDPESSSSGGGEVTGTSVADATGTGGPSGPKAVARKAPIKVGFIGALSGAAGVTVSSARDGWVVWAKMINAKGGINGHPIEVLVGDDGTNDARGVAIARDFVENKGAVALSWASNDISGLAAYAKKQRVPIIGVVEGQAVWAENPMMFPTSTGAAGGWGTMRAAKMAGATKIALLYCVEAQTCETGANGMTPYAAEEGVEIVYRAGVSLTQPDYTAECIQARNRDAEGVVLLVDQNSVTRFVQSCLRQGYDPIPMGPASDAMAKLPEMDGLVSGGSTFPWFLRTGAPGVLEYVQALQRYAPKLLTDGSAFQTLSWVAAKVFEKAVQNATSTTNPERLTSEDVLRGLWAMRGETLDGLAQGGMARTYTRGQPAPKVFCGFVSRLKGGKWSSLTGIKPVCR